MKRPIPVFAFAFAAYAASVESVARAPADEPRAIRRKVSFTSAWRTHAESGAELLVKVGVLDAARCEAVGEGGADAADFKEIWLGEIRETAQGYTGVACMAQAPLRHIRPGQRIAFHPRHILDWTLSYGVDEDRAEPTRCETN